MGIVVEEEWALPVYSSTTTKRWLLLIDVAASAAPNNPSAWLRKWVSTHSPCEQGRYPPPNHYFQFGGIVEHLFFLRFDNHEAVVGKERLHGYGARNPAGVARAVVSVHPFAVTLRKIPPP